MKNSVLVGCIQSLNNTIRTRFFYVEKESNEVRDVTLELYQRIEDFNKEAKKIRDTGEYAMLIPYSHSSKTGLIEYSFGCGLSHYLQENMFELIVERSEKPLSFPLTDCRISMYTPSDVKSILSCKGVYDSGIEDALRERFGLQKIA